MYHTARSNRLRFQLFQLKYIIHEKPYDGRHRDIKLALDAYIKVLEKKPWWKTWGRGKK